MAHEVSERTYMYLLHGTRKKINEPGQTALHYTGEKHEGILFYDSEELVLRYSDGETPGGIPLNTGPNIDYTNAQEGFTLIYNQETESFVFGSLESVNGSTSIFDKVFDLSGNVFEIFYSQLPSRNILSTYVLNPLGKMVSVQQRFFENRLQIASNVDLDGHRLYITYR